MNNVVIVYDELGTKETVTLMGDIYTIDITNDGVLHIFQDGSEFTKYERGQWYSVTSQNITTIGTITMNEKEKPMMAVDLVEE